MSDLREPCCQDPANLDEVLSERRGDLTLRRCRVCNRRHFELAVDPGIIGLRSE